MSFMYYAEAPECVDAVGKIMHSGAKKLISFIDI